MNELTMSELCKELEKIEKLNLELFHKCIKVDKMLVFADLLYNQYRTIRNAREQSFSAARDHFSA